MFGKHSRNTCQDAAVVLCVCVRAHTHARCVCVCASVSVCVCVCVTRVCALASWSIVPSKISLSLSLPPVNTTSSKHKISRTPHLRLSSSESRAPRWTRGWRRTKRRRRRRNEARWRASERRLAYVHVTRINAPAFALNARGTVQKRM